MNRMAGAAARRDCGCDLRPYPFLPSVRAALRLSLARRLSSIPALLEICQRWSILATCDEAENDGPYGCHDQAVLFAVMAAGAAEAIDLSFARDKVRTTAPVTPTVMVGQNGAQVGMVGRF